jgi:predicted RNA-binding Zn-ribbon protein involved in translation (DUF1610 family)
MVFFKSKAGKKLINFFISIAVAGIFILIGFLFPEPKTETETSYRYGFFILAFIILTYFGGSALHSLFSGDDQFGLSTTTYSCPNCGHKLSLKDIPSDSLKSFTCPSCGNILKST